MNICSDIDTTLTPCTHYVTSGKPGFCSLKSRFRCIEYIVRKAPILSHSYIQSYLRCRRLFYWSWLMGWQSVNINLIPFNGQIVHDGLAYLHSENDFFLKQMDQKKNQLNEQYPNGVPYECYYIKPVINAYHDLGLHLIGGNVEQSKLVELEWFSLKGITDLDADDWIMDYKYTKNADYINFFNIEYQASTYFILNPEKKKIMFRCITKPTTKQGKNESLQEFQDRIQRDIVRRPNHYITDKTFHRAEFDLERVMDEFSIHSDRIKELISKGDEAFWSQNRSGCFAYGSWCDFHDCCKSRVDPETLPHLYKRRDVEDNVYTAK